MLKKYVSIVCLLVIGFQLIGFYPLFMTVEHEIKEQMHKLLMGKIDPGKIITFKYSAAKGKITDPSYHISQDGDELTYEGNMYDVVRKEVRGTEVIYYCIADHEETNLVASYNTHVSRNLSDQSDNQKKSNNLIKLIQQEYLEQDGIRLLPESTQCCSIRSTEPSIASQYLLGYSTPPPECMI